MLELVAAEPRAPDQLVRVTGLDAATVAGALVELELAGAAIEADGLYRSALRDRAPPRHAGRLTPGCGAVPSLRPAIGRHREDEIGAAGGLRSHP